MFTEDIVTWENIDLEDMGRFDLEK